MGNSIYEYPIHKPSYSRKFDCPIKNRAISEVYIEDLYIKYETFTSSQRDDIISLFDNKHISKYNSRLITPDNINNDITLAITNCCVIMSKNAEYSKEDIVTRYTIYDNIYCILLIKDSKIIDLEIPYIGTTSAGSSEPTIKFIS